METVLAALLSSLMLSLLHGFSALLCYDGPNLRSAVLINCTTCRLCGIYSSNLDQNEAAHGMVKQEEFDLDENSVFQAFVQNTDSDIIRYKTLSICMLESYSIPMPVDSSSSEVLPSNPTSVQSKPETVYRCFCNSDECNKSGSISDYLRRLQRLDSQPLKTGRNSYRRQAR